MPAEKKKIADTWLLSMEDLFPLHPGEPELNADNGLYALPIIKRTVKNIFRDLTKNLFHEVVLTNLKIIGC